jgi:hypothetical protein
MIPVEIVLFNTALVAQTLAAMSAGATLNAFQHNLIVAAFAQAMDRIAQPKLAVVAGAWPLTMPPDGALPAEVSADGKQPANLELPTFGMVPRPADGDALKWWDACAEFLFKLGSTWEIAGNTSAIPGSSMPVLVAGPAYDAVIAMRAYPGVTTIREDPQTAVLADPLYLGASAYIQRSANAAIGVATEMQGPERSAQATVETLGKEFRESQSNTTMAVLLGSVGIVGAAAWYGSRKAARR